MMGRLSEPSCLVNCASSHDWSDEWTADKKLPPEGRLGILRGGPASGLFLYTSQFLVLGDLHCGDRFFLLLLCCGPT